MRRLAGGIDRRTFLLGLSGPLIGVPLSSENRFSVLPSDLAVPTSPASENKTCWLEVCAPFVVEDPFLQLSTELLLTSTCFPGVDGFREEQSGVEHEIRLYDGHGQEIDLGGGGRILISAMRPTLIPIADLTGRRPLWGSARIRLAPLGSKVKRAGDLFSAAFLRWNTPANFDNIHAQPPVPSNASGRFFYSMPLPPLSEYHCAYVLFNPGNEEAHGLVRIVEPSGRKATECRYKLHPHQTILYSLPALSPSGSPAEALATAPEPSNALRNGGVVVVENHSEQVSFAYTLMKGRQGSVFSVEHPLHFADAPIKPARRSPYGPNHSFPAEALLFTPLLFSGLRIGEVELETRIYLSASRWREEALWLMPFVTGADGMIVWVSDRDDQFRSRVFPGAFTEQGLIRLGFFQSCRLDARRLPLQSGFSGGMGVAAIPPTSHSLMKVEVCASNWSRVGFSHFRPGGQFHKRYRQVDARGGLASDYIVSGCQVRRSGSDRKHDCLLAIMNIEFQDERAGFPKIQLFGPAGLVAEKSLGEFEPLACRHLLLSKLFPDLETEPARPLTARMVDSDAMMVMSALHLDYERHDIAIDHGSDRHSTYSDYIC